MQRNSSRQTLTAITSLRPSEPTQDATLLRQAWVAAPARGRDFILRLEDGRLLPARRAAACLLEPAVGDTVLAWTPSQGRAYICSVLETAGKDSRISLQGNVTMEAADGRLDLQAQGMSLKAGNDLDIEAGSLSLRGVTATMQFVRTRLQSLDLELRARKVSSVCDSLRSTARSLVQELGDSLRRVKNVETLEAGHLRERVRHTRHSLAGSIVARARKRMKLDGKRIDLG